MREYLKKIPVVRATVLSWRSFWKSLQQNPDVLERIERKIFEHKHKDIPLPPPTPHEIALIRALRTKMETLAIEVPTPSTPGPETMWIKYKNGLREKILTEDPRNFYKWDVVVRTMGATLSRRNYIKLSAFPFWKEWSVALKALPPIYQHPYFKYPHTDGTTLFNVYHLAQLKKYINREVTDVDCIIDFGGGYGSMCAAANALGFEGRYILFDWPEFLLLQEFYLKLHNVDTSRIQFISTLPELKQAIAGKRGLLIATWSLSEVSEEFREKFLSVINPSDYLIGHQRSVREANNDAYFKTLTKKHPNIIWKDFSIFDLTGVGNRYLLGSEKE